MKKMLINLSLRLPWIGKHLTLYRKYKQLAFEPGHYYSPIPDLEEVQKRTDQIFGNDTVKDIDFHEDNQLELLNELKTYYASLPYSFDDAKTDSSSNRYKVKDAFYRNSDAIFLYCMMRHFKPGRIVEIGSGHSSALMLDTNELSPGQETEFVFIEPFPEERLNQVLGESRKSNVQVLKQFVQDVSPEVFTALGKDDFLFVDSSHVSKTGSDLNYIFFEVLPSLSKGTLIHFHDIFFPFEMPKPWIMGRKWFWNENYILRAFLMNNADYEIVLFNDFLHKKHTAWFEQNMPWCLIDRENTGSIWIRKK
jgi:predicted O-methyltransferase YrrM